MYARLLNKPTSSILLLGPRGTGKSTWIKQVMGDTIRYDLLNNAEAIRLGREPSAIYHELAGLPEGSWVVIDEVQKVPQLLDEVHRLMEDKRLNFVLSGSSARKLKRGGVNLLAGRAQLTRMFPLTSAETAFDFQIKERLVLGMLPLAILGADPQGYLRTYAEVYLQEEIKGEAVARNIGQFSRFLDVAARQNGQVTNASSISRDAQVSRQTVQGYFEILTDTLIGNWLEPWKLKRATKQVTHPKFYFFDTGVARALIGRLPYPPTPEELGPLFETFIHSELKAYMEYSGKHYPVYYWRNHNGVELDFFIETSKGFIALEIKSSDRWNSRFNLGFKHVRAEMPEAKCIGVYLGDRTAQYDFATVMPAMEFLKALWSNAVIDI